MTKSQRMWKREQERRRQERIRRARRRRNCAIIVLLAVIIVAVIAISRACRGGYDTTTPAAETDELRVTEPPAADSYRSSRDESEINTAFFENSAFLGSAVADSISMYGLLPQTSFYTSVTLDLDNVYTTIAGYGTVSAADSLKSTKFNKIFLSFGDRELELNNAQEFGQKYRTLVEKVRAYQQNAQIYVIAIPPSSKTASDTNLYGASASNIADYNRQIENIAEDYKLFYVDSVIALANSNRFLPDGISSDGISLNRDCCIDLLYYIENNSYVPDPENARNNGNQENADANGQNSADTDSSTNGQPAGAATAAPSNNDATNSQNTNTSAQYGTAVTPAPTVNVLKDSAVSQE